MKVDALKKIIKEAVKEAIKEELREAVPPQTAPVQEEVKAQPLSKPIFNTNNPLSEILNQTAATMTNEDFDKTISFDSSAAQNFQPGSTAAMNAAPKVGLDLSNLDFTKKAGAILKAADEKTKARHGV